MTTNVVVRLTVEPQSGEVEVATFILSWTDPKQPGRLTTEVSLRLPAVTTDAYMKLAEDVTVAEQVAR